MSSKDAASSPMRSGRIWRRHLPWLAPAVVLLTAVSLFRASEGNRTVQAESKNSHLTRRAKGEKLPRVGHPQHDVMALVNGQDISRQDLMDACIRRYGEDVLESLVKAGAFDSLLDDTPEMSVAERRARLLAASDRAIEHRGDGEDLEVDDAESTPGPLHEG